MAKDPAFLFYSKDWIEGTAGLLPAEKGIYIDLMAHQHQKGFIPSDTIRLARLAGISESEFLPVWVHISEKFVEVEPGKLMNKRLMSEMNDRKTKGHKNKIIGLFASLIRQAKISSVQKEQIKQSFKIDDFLPLTTELATERLSQWFAIRLKSIGNGNEDANADSINDGEKVFHINEALIPAMMKEFKTRNHKYLEQKETDFTSLRSIAEMIHTWDEMAGIFTELRNHEKIRIRWGEICDHVKADSHYIKYSLSQIEKHFQSILQSFSNATNNNSKGAGKDKVHTTGHSGL